jgi:hypothetical protein
MYLLTKKNAYIWEEHKSMYHLSYVPKTFSAMRELLKHWVRNLQLTPPALSQQILFCYNTKRPHFLEYKKQQCWWRNYHKANAHTHYTYIFMRRALNVGVCIIAAF